MACLARQRRRGGAARGCSERAAAATSSSPRAKPRGRRGLPASAGAGRSWAAPAELAGPEARGAVLGQGASDLFLRVTASRGQILAPFVSVVGAFCSPLLPPALELAVAGGDGRGGRLVSWCPVLPSSSVEGARAEEATEGPQGGSGSPGPNLGPSPGQTPCEELEGWTQPSSRLVRRREKGICAQRPRGAELGLGREEGASRALLRPRVWHRFLGLPEGAKLPRLAGVSAHE